MFTRAGLESIDYAVDHLGTNLIMVAGHDHCGAVKGALAECIANRGWTARNLRQHHSGLYPAADVRNYQVRPLSRSPRPL